MRDDRETSPPPVREVRPTSRVTRMDATPRPL
jgi:hypothetical protein